MASGHRRGFVDQRLVGEASRASRHRARRARPVAAHRAAVVREAGLDPLEPVDLGTLPGQGRQDAGPRGDARVLSTGAEQGEAVAAHGQRGGGRPGSGVDHHPELERGSFGPERRTPDRQPVEDPPRTSGTKSSGHRPDVDHPVGSPARSHGGHMTLPRSRGQLPPGAGHVRPTTIGPPRAATAHPCVPGPARRPGPDRRPGRSGPAPPLPPMVGLGWLPPRRADRRPQRQSGLLASRRSFPGAPAERTGTASDRFGGSRGQRALDARTAPPFCGGVTGRPCASGSMVRLMSRTPRRSRPRVSVKLVPIGRGNCLTYPGPPSAEATAEEPPGPGGRCPAPPSGTDGSGPAPKDGRPPESVVPVRLPSP